MLSRTATRDEDMWRAARGGGGCAVERTRLQPVLVTHVGRAGEGGQAASAAATRAGASGSASTVVADAHAPVHVGRASACGCAGHAKEDRDLVPPQSAADESSAASAAAILFYAPRPAFMPPCMTGVTLPRGYQSWRTKQDGSSAGVLRHQ